MPSTKPIGVFDSGVGGLSVLLELKKLLPNEDFVFLADQKNVPYGEKSKEELIGFMHGVTTYFAQHHDIKLLVIACNTASCYTYDELRKKYPFQIVRTIPAVKPASESTKRGTIAVMSTPATSKSPVVKELIKDYCKEVNVLNIGCKNLENAVENGNLKGAQVNKLLKKYLKEVNKSDADCLVLGCTHYPFLRNAIKKMVSPKVKILDSGLAIAKRTKSLLKTLRIKNTQKRREAVYLTTGNSQKFEKVAGQLLNKKIKAKKVKI